MLEYQHKIIRKELDKVKNRATIDTTRHDTPLLSVIMPSIPADIGTLINNSEFYFRYLPIKNIYVAGPESISETIRNTGDSRLIFMNENEFCDIKRLREIYLSRTSENPGRVGWYVQQFIKMQFARITEDEYYLIWDGDTIPVRPVNLFDSESKPVFDMKTITYPYSSSMTFTAYHDTMMKLLPCIRAPYEKSFVTEHIMVNSQYMRECLDEIESCGAFCGDNFQEKVMYAVYEDYLHSTGFSEYQTYGNFTVSRHPGSYVMRDWRSLRLGQRLWDNATSISEEEISWLATRYYALSIEKWQKPTKLAYLAQSRLFRALFPPTSFERIIDFAVKVIPKRCRTFIKSLLEK